MPSPRNVSFPFLAALSLVLGCGDDPSGDQPKADGTGGSPAITSSSSGSSAGGADGSGGAGRGQGGGLISSGALNPVSGSGGGLNWELVDTACEKICDCTEQTGGSCVDDCATQTEPVVAAAGVQGCGEEARGVLDCISKNLECPPDLSLPLHACWSQVRTYAKCLGAPIPVADGPSSLGSGGSGGGSPLDLLDVLNLDL